MNDIYSKAQEYALSSGSPNKESRRKGYVDGYNKAREKYQFTERQLDEAIDWALKKGREGDVTITDIDNFIQSLLQQNKDNE